MIDRLIHLLIYKLAQQFTFETHTGKRKIFKHALISIGLSVPRGHASRAQVRHSEHLRLFLCVAFFSTHMKDAKVGPIHIEKKLVFSVRHDQMHADSTVSVARERVDLDDYTRAVVGLTVVPSQYLTPVQTHQNSDSKNTKKSTFQSIKPKNKGKDGYVWCECAGPVRQNVGEDEDFQDQGKFCELKIFFFK